MHFFPEARSTYVSARHGLERARTYAEAAAVAVGNGTGHMPRQDVEARESFRSELQRRTHHSPCSNHAGVNCASS